MGSTKGIIVEIAGKDYSIVSDVDKNVTKDIAELVDIKMGEIDEALKKSSKTPLKVAVLSAMTFAGEAYEYKRKLEIAENELDKIKSLSEKLSNKISKVSN